MSFICSCCGNEHDELPEPAYQRPDEVWRLTVDAMKARLSGNNDLCILRGETEDEPSRFFIRGILFMPIAETEQDWAIGAWVEVLGEDFERYQELYDQDAEDEPWFVGKIANAVKSFEDILGAEVAVQLGPASERPTIWFPTDSELELAQYQEHGIPMTRIHDVVGHFE